MVPSTKGRSWKKRPPGSDRWDKASMNGTVSKQCLAKYSQGFSWWWNQQGLQKFRGNGISAYWNRMEKMHSTGASSRGDLLAKLVECVTWSRGSEFKPHVGSKAYIKRKKMAQGGSKDGVLMTIYYLGYYWLHLLWARHCAKSFPCIVLFTPLNNIR